jgi:hypothetical protein
MSYLRQFVFSLGLVWLGLASCFVFAGTDNTENNKRLEFGKAYSSVKADERRAALDILKGCQERATLAMVLTVARMDKERDVRVAAFQLASGWNDPDGMLTGMLVPIVQEEKDREAKRQMMQCFPKLQLKRDAIVETMKLLCSLSYPEYGSQDNNNNNNNNNGGGGANFGRASQEAVNKQKAYFDDILQVFNTLAGQHLTGSTNTRGEVKKWWATHEADVVKADRETVEKLRGANAPAKKDSKVSAVP